MHDQSGRLPADNAAAEALHSSAGSNTCETCGTPFKRRTTRQRFCSRACYRQWWLANVQRTAATRGTQRLREILATPGPESDHIRERIATSYQRREQRGQASPGKSRERPAPVQQLQPEDEGDDIAWAERGEYWARSAVTPAKKRKGGGGRTGVRQPLVLTGHGVRLAVDRGALLVRDGFTHYPQVRQEWRLFPGDRTLPARIVVLDSDGALSFDVLAWLAQQQIPLVLLNWQGAVVSTFGGDGVAADPALRQAQVAALANGVGLRLAIQLIEQKVLGCQATLRTLLVGPARELALRKLDGVLEGLQQTPPVTVEALRLVEARAALAYFTCWHALPLRWTGTNRKPVPEAWHRVGLRQSLLSGTNRHATHPMNAILNYAYGMLESQVRIAAVAAGLDPTIGYLHACQPGRAALVYDLMEPLRPRVDRLVLDLVRARTLAASDIVLSTRGVCRLHPRLAGAIAALSVDNDAVQRIIAEATACILCESDDGAPGRRGDAAGEGLLRQLQQG